MFALSSHANANPLIYSTYFLLRAIHTYKPCLWSDKDPHIVLVHRYSSIDALRATFIHNCCCLFVQAPFLVQGCAILQNLLYFIATVILNLHALTMCCGQKFTNHVAAKAISYKHMFRTPAFTCVRKDHKAFLNFTLYIQAFRGCKGSSGPLLPKAKTFIWAVAEQLCQSQSSVPS